jgi:hypothetical protein
MNDKRLDSGSWPALCSQPGIGSVRALQGPDHLLGRRLGEHFDLRLADGWTESISADPSALGAPNRQLPHLSIPGGSLATAGWRLSSSSGARGGIHIDLDTLTNRTSRTWDRLLRRRSRHRRQPKPPADFDRNLDLQTVRGRIVDPGVHLGIRAHHTRCHFIRAALEGVCLRLSTIGDSLDTVAPVQFIRATGRPFRFDL